MLTLQTCAGGSSPRHCCYRSHHGRSVAGTVKRRRWNGVGSAGRAPQRSPRRRETRAAWDPKSCAPPREGGAHGQPLSSPAHAKHRSRSGAAGSENTEAGSAARSPRCAASKDSPKTSLPMRPSPSRASARPSPTASPSPWVGSSRGRSGRQLTAKRQRGLGHDSKPPGTKYCTLSRPRDRRQRGVQPCPGPRSSNRRAARAPHLHRMRSESSR